MAYEWQSDIIRPDGENGTEVLDGQGVYQPQIEGGDNITIENGRINASGTLENVQASWSETNPSDPSYIKNKPDLSIYATASGMETELASKQDVISDLATIRSGAEAGSTAVQPGDLAAVATTGSYTSLSNTPQNIVQDANYVHTDNNFSNADVAKLSGIAAGAEVNVQSDWNEADSASDSFIKNKPTIPAAQQNADWNASSGVTAILNKPDLSAYATDSELTAGLATKQNVISDLDTIRSGASAGATAVQPSQLPSSDELVPDVTSTDDGKVLTASYSGGQGSYSWQTAQGGSSDVFIVEDSTTQGDVYTAYTSGKVLFYRASSGEMYYMSLSQFSTPSELYFFGAYVGGYGTHATVVHFDAWINLVNGAPVAPNLPFSSALGNIETIQTPSPLPTVTGNAGKVLAVNSSATGVEWINNVPIEVVASMPASPTAGVLYIVTGA